MNMNCRLAIPYPSVRVQEKNTHYAEMLMPAYTGAYSELSAVASYGYQSLITQNKDKRLSDILECISVIEMKHFRILGELIHKLGIDPVLYIRIPRGKLQYWSSNFADFTNDPNTFLHNNIKSEERSLYTYNSLYRDISDQSVREIIDRIIADEEHHIKIFKELMK